MSYFGNNIKKIRAIKKFSQTQFAEIFSLSRANIGSYEEGRAEAKIDTIIEIAKYFSLSLDALLTKELTVNELQNFDLLKNNQFNNTQFTLQNKIPYIDKSNYKEYIVNFGKTEFLNNLSFLHLPFSAQLIFRAFEYNSNNMKMLNKGDILICSHADINNLKIKQIYVFVTSKNIITKELIEISDDKICKFTDNSETLFIPQNDILEIWELKGVYSTKIKKGNTIEERVSAIENRLKNLNSIKK